jgi:HEPN domain-containing protein
MNEVVKEWLAKAEGDYRTAKRELDVQDTPNFDAVCFHSQQCIEKLMKALLILRGSNPAKTHDLIFLNQLIISVLPGWFLDIKYLRFLTRAAVEFRYPGELADYEEAQEAFNICTCLREKLLGYFD